jgi:hypothetical protein
LFYVVLNDKNWKYRFNQSESWKYKKFSEVLIKTVTGFQIFKKVKSTQKRRFLQNYEIIKNRT